MEFLVFVHRDATSVVLDGYGFVFIDGHFYVGAISCHRLVDGVVHGLIHQMVQSFLAYVADIHRRSLAHGFKSFEHLNVTGGVIACVVLCISHFLA